MLPIYNDYFNVISGIGIIPDALFKGTIFLICKRSGDPTNPDKYRSITLVSCFSILFVSIVSARIHQDSEDGIEKLHPMDHRLASLDLPSDDKR